MSPPPGRVLVADDNGVTRYMLAQHVRLLGHEVTAVENGQKVLDALLTRPVDLVLLDVMMPELDGFAVLERMRADDRWRDVPVVMVSGVDETDSVARCIENGAEDYLPKPVDPVLLRARVGACLEKKRLRDAEREKTAELEVALAQLRSTQDQLVAQQKLAALGTLTAGIAHEIKNPLNFVTNFARLTADLVRELRGLLPGAAGDVAEVLALIEENVGKIDAHGRRADAIVRSMLEHSRGGGGERRKVDLNALVAEYVALAYHGLRAADPTQSVVIEGRYDPAVGQVEAVPQELSRVFLNLAQNACQAVLEKRAKAGPGYTPTVTVTTAGRPAEVEVRVRDNGPGVPAALRERVFQPFFTTKPAGVGTGLGLSISFDVIRQHGGEFRLESEEGEYAEFVVVLPRGAESPRPASSS